MKKTTDKQAQESESGRQEHGTGSSDSQLSRRRFTGAGLAAPVILSLASRPAFGAVCTPSGFVSYAPNNPSGLRRHEAACGGFSPGAWKTPDSGNGDGSRAQWLPFAPNPRQGGNSSPGNSGRNKNKKSGGGDAFTDPPGTLFFDVFGVNDHFGTLHDVLLDRPGSLEFHVVAALLNSTTIPGYMATDDVIGLYLATIYGYPSYTTVKGGVIPLAGFDLKAFIEQTYH
ncbi:MAG: hypothetical protein RJQ10_03495 [Haliea sp.]|uniref:hypothetical protein n=1 Tax=Haliea sp. TaxID=1932666 RepID=UPI0032EAB2C4